MSRYIPVTVKQEYMEGSGVMIGAAGSHDDVYLRMAFGNMWEGLAKYVTFRDAAGENPTLVALEPHMVVPGTTDTYDVPTPAAAKAIEGRCSVTVSGYTVVNDTQEDTATLTVRSFFRVLPSDYALFEDGSIDATLAQQIQAEIEDIKDDILDARQAAKDSEAWAVGQVEGVDVPDTADQYDNNSKYYAQQAASSADTAAGSAGDASDYATAANDAKTAAVAAQGYAEAAQTAAETAQGKAEDAQTAAETAQGKAEDAQEAAETAQGKAEDAQEAAETAVAGLVPEFVILQSKIQMLEEMQSLNDQIALPFEIKGSGYINSTGNVSNTSSTVYKYTDYVDIRAFDQIKYKRGGGTGSVAQYAALYDKNKTALRQIKWASNQQTAGYLAELSAIDLQPGEVYARFTAYTDTDTYGTFAVYGTKYGLLNVLTEENDSWEE